MAPTGMLFAFSLARCIRYSIEEDRIQPASAPERVRASRLPVDCVLFEVGVDGAAYGRIEVFGAEAFE
jgi:hypothetical protein